MSMPVVLRFYNLHAGNGRRGITLRLQQTLSMRQRKVKPTEALEQKAESERFELPVPRGTPD